MEQHIFGVTEVNNLVKLLLDNEPMLQNICVRGELSNYKMYPSGHHYFTLKDPEGALRCVMFKGSAMRLRFRPENGMKVLVTGRVTVFPRDGAYQLYCNTMTPEGAGDLAVAFEQLKARLYAEGLFDPAHNKPLPPYPEKIAIVTSSAGAAVHDMIRILRRRYPIAKVILLPVRVQGAEAPPEIAGAIRYANRWKVGDLIIIRDHINLMPNPLIGPNIEEFGERFPDMTCAYDLQIHALAESLCPELGIPVKKGVYLASTGPTYETPAEVRFYHSIGADLLGMSTVPEVIVARHCGLRVFGMSVVTNMSNFLNAEKNYNDGNDVVKQANLASERMTALFTRMIAAL